MSANFYSSFKSSYVIMHVVEAFGAGVAHSIHQIYSGYCSDLKGVVVHGARDFDKDLQKKSVGVSFIKWNAVRDISPSADLKSLLSLVNIIRDVRPTLIHAHSSKAGVIARLAALLTRTPCVYTPHSYAFLRTDVTRGKRMLFRAIESVLAPAAVTIACGLEEYAHASQLSRSATIVENGVDFERFRPNSIPKVPSSRPRIVSVGRISPQKDFEFFERLALSDKLSMFDFVWVSGDDRDERNLHPNLEIIGRRSPDELAEIYRSSDIYISTARWEGLSRAALEATLSGMPLLLRDSPGNRELLFRLPVCMGFDSLEEAVGGIISLHAQLLDNITLGEENRSSGLQHYSHKSVQARIRSIYDGIAFKNLVSKELP